MGFEESGKTFREAERCVMHGDVLNAFDLYCDALLDRLSLNHSCLDFLLFYRSQLIKYLKEKKSFFLSLPEGDMISDLIYSAYEDFLSSCRNNPFIKTDRGRFRLLMSVKIIFPVQNDTAFQDLPLIVSK